MATRISRSALRELERCVWVEYLEMPGQRLTAAQASRLWAVDQKASAKALGRLVAGGFLRHVGPYYFRADYGHRCV